MKKLWRTYGEKPLLKSYTALCSLCALVCFFTACPNANIPSRGDSGAHNNNNRGTVITVTVLDSVGGTLLSEPTTLTVYKADTVSLACTPVTITNGTAQLYLPKDQCYDLHLSGKKDKRAASVIENYWVRGEQAQTVTMIQRAVQIGAVTQAPSIQSVTLNGIPFEDGGVWAGTVGQTMRLQIICKAPSRAIQARPTDWNFGCAVGIGEAPSSRNNIAAVSPVCERDTDGSWKCTANFAFDAISFLNEFNDFIITAYDLAGNRVERHINSIEFKERRPGLKTMTGSVIGDFRVEMHRFPHSLKLFSIPDQSNIRPFGIMPHNGESNTYEVLLYFRIKDSSSNDLPIRGFNIYRRKQGEAEWVHVGRKQYTKDYIGEQDPRYPAYKGLHLGYDTDPSLEEGVTYEYKVAPFIDSSHHRDSPIATARLLPANTIQLEYPADNGAVKKSELDNLSFSFRITNPAIWENRLADSFSFGLFITEKTSTEKIVFAGSITVHLKAAEGERLHLLCSVSGNPQSYSFADLQRRGVIAAGAQEDDYISYENGLITVKPAYLKEKRFNHPLFKDEMFQTGVTYAWDIFNWGEKPKHTYDDEPAVFKAEWLSKDVDGNEIPASVEPKSSSESFASGLRYASSLNGQCYFKITDE